MRLDGRVALITGASRGIGRGIAIAFAREGARIVVNFNRSRDLAEETVRLIRESGGQAVLIHGDAGETDHMNRVFEGTISAFGRLDIYVNNANAGRRVASESSGYLDVSEEELFQGFYPSFKAAYVNGQIAARQMIAQGNGGSIINITSVHQARAWESDTVYGSMKAAIRRLTMGQARELAPYGIRVNAIAPGFIDIRLYPGERGDRYDWHNRRAATEIPLGPGVPADIAVAAVYLASDDSRYVTGACLLVDGGMLTMPGTEI